MKSVTRKGRIKVRVRGTKRRNTIKRGGAEEPNGHWDGKRVDGKREGYGRMQYYNGDLYEGNFKNDEKYYYGAMEYSNGDIYRGNWKNNERDGFGKMKPKGVKLWDKVPDAVWKKDTVVAPVDYDDGKYLGQFDNDGKRFGPGIMKYKNRNVYTGYWRNDMKDTSTSTPDEKERPGVMKYANGDGYEGGWRNDLRDTTPSRPGEEEQPGTMKYANGTTLVGNWRNDSPVLSIGPSVVDSNQVHKAAAKIDYGGLRLFLKTHIPTLPPQPVNAEFATYINESLKSLIENITSSLPTDPTKERLENLESIMSSRLRNASYDEFSAEQLSDMFLSLEYTKLQAPTFKENYIDAFLNDTCIAYGENKSLDNMSCINGARERLILSLSPAATAALSTNDATKETEYKELIETIINNPQTRTPDLIIEWKKQFFEGKGLEDKSIDERKQMLTKYITGRVNPTNDPKINVIIDNLTQYAEVGDEADFDYKGGTKRRRKRLKKGNKTKKRKLRKRKGAK